MTYYDTSHWAVATERCGLLLFAQAFEELMASHSHDSYKVPALNFHYICIEIDSVINLVERDALDKGNLIPLFAEMKQLFNCDPIAQMLFGNNFDAIFATKNSKGDYDKKPLNPESNKDFESVLPALKKGISFMIAEMSRNNQYYKRLVAEIKEQISNCNSDLLKLNALYDLVKIVASELINKGFSQAYIYDCIKSTFFDSANEVASSDAINAFFYFFESANREFVLYLPLNSIKQKYALEGYGIFEIADNIFEMFDPSVPYVLKYQCKETDPYSARDSAVEIANFCLSVNQFIKHNKYEYNPKYAEVVEKNIGNVSFIKKSETAIMRGYTNHSIVEANELLETCFGLKTRIFQVLQLHSSALTSNNVDNQLINLWTAVEVAVPITRKDNLSRVNQICNTLTAVLGKRYYETLTHQLLTDIKAVSIDLFEKVMSLPCSTSDSKLISALLLPENSGTYDELCDFMLEYAPILACRIHRYRSWWSSKSQIKENYIAHSKRLSQQIMRIYRTRNMLVHDGTSLPYTEYVLQNLHYYVDSFVEVLNSYCKLGYSSVQTIVGALQLEEQLYLNLLSDESAITIDTISKYILREDPIA